MGTSIFPFHPNSKKITFLTPQSPTHKAEPKTKMERVGAPAISSTMEPRGWEDYLKDCRVLASRQSMLEKIHRMMHSVRYSISDDPLP